MWPGTYSMACRLKSNGEPMIRSMASSGIPRRERRYEKPPEFESVADVRTAGLPDFHRSDSRRFATHTGLL